MTKRLSLRRASIMAIILATSIIAIIQYYLPELPPEDLNESFHVPVKLSKYTASKKHSKYSLPFQDHREGLFANLWVQEIKPGSHSEEESISGSSGLIQWKPVSSLQKVQDSSSERHNKLDPSRIQNHGFSRDFLDHHFESLSQRIAVRSLKDSTNKAPSTRDIPLHHFLLQQPENLINTMLRNQSLAAKDFQLLSRVAKFDTKYFQESGVDMKLDSRFLEEQEESTNATSSSSTTYYKRRYDYDMMHTSLVSLLRVWSNFCSERGFVWWIAHGPLLGWLWNQKLLPWDPDLDIQVSLTQLIQLIPFNQTMMNDRFLLDMTPNIYYRLPQSMNAIDARLIDTKTGFMLDITALAVTNSAEEPTKISCKKPHSYSYDSIMPLYETELEGIRVYRPNHVLGILKDEYQESSMTTPTYMPPFSKQTYVWHYSKEEWVLQKQGKRGS